MASSVLRDTALAPETGLPIFPDRAEWAALTPAQREAVLEAMREALAATSETQPGETTRHSATARGAINLLESHYGRLRRGVFIAQGLGVYSPGEAVFSPDVLAVLDVPLHHRDGWVVQDEGRGLDFVLEVLVKGDRHKDLELNVRRYARLGIPEYFVYDVPAGKLYGYRLVTPDAARYTRIVPQHGRLPCERLGVDLAILDGRLRFFVGGGEIPGLAEELDLVARLLGEETARGDAAEAETASALAALRGAIRGVLQARSLDLSPEDAARVESCEEAATLAAWVVRAATVAQAADLFRA